MKDKREFWSTHIEGWKVSGQCQRDYCGERGLAVSTFQWWNSRLKSESGSSTTSVALVAVAPEVVRGSFDGDERSALRIRIGRFVVEVETGFDRSVLRDVLDVLASR